MEPTVSFSTDVNTLVESEGTVITFNFEVDGDIPEGGLPINFDIDAASPLWIADFNNFSRTGLNEDTGEIQSLFILGNPEGLGGEISSFSGSLLLRDIPLPFDEFPLILEDNQASFEIEVFDDIAAEADEIITFSVEDGSGYTVGTDSSEVVTIQDIPTGIDNPSNVPEISLSIDAADPLIEDINGSREVTLTFNVDESLGAIPLDGIPIILESDTFDILGDFDSDSIVTTGFSLEGRFGGISPLEFGRGIIATIVDDVATLTLNVNNDSTPEGIEDFTFSLTDGEAYDVAAGAGSVSLSIQDPGPATVINGTSGDDSLRGTDPDSTTIGQNDILRGRAGDDTLRGLDGNDELDGAEGEDILVGGAGIDTLLGGEGNDTIRGGDGSDSAVGGDGDDEIRGEDGFDTLFGNDGNDLLVAGNSESDGGLIDGGNGRDTIIGGDGNSTLIGGRGRDRITGDIDDDTIFGGAGRDTIRASADDDIVSGGRLADVIFGGDDDDSIFGDQGRDTLRGESGDDLLSGGVGDDLIFGGDGDDLLMGVTEDDTLSGGAGSDTFVFGSGDGRDVILDFEDGVDFIGLVEGELTFDNLNIARINDNLRIRDAGTGDVLALVRDETAAIDLDAADFVTVPDISDISDVL